MVSFEGYLTAIDKNDGTGLLERAHVDVANITFMGRAIVTPKTPEPTGKQIPQPYVMNPWLTEKSLLSGSVTPAKRGYRFSFNSPGDGSPVATKRAKSNAKA